MALGQGEARGGLLLSRGSRNAPVLGVGVGSNQAKGGIVLPKYARGAVAISIGALPLLTPSGPGNTGPVDLAVFGAICCVLFAAFSEHIAMRLPFALPIALTILGGGIGALVHDRAGASLLDMVQILLMLFYGGVVATAAQHGPTLRWLMRWWVRVGIVSSFGLVIGVTLGIKALSGYTAREFNRAAFLFGDPNRCGLFIMLSFLIMRASQYPRRPINRYAVGCIMLVAMFYTGSNAAVVGLTVACTVSAFIGAGRRGNVVTLVAWLAGGAVVFGTLAMTVDVQKLSSTAGSVGILSNSLGRASKSTDSRGEILKSNTDLFFRNSFLGLGQGGTKDTLKDTGASYVKEAHNDYMAAANETGLIGMIGLVLLIALIGARVGPMLALKPPEHLLKYVPRPDLLGSAALGIAVTAALHQTLHFRHEWAYFGLLAGAALLARRGEDLGGHSSAIHVREAAAPAEDRAHDNPFGRG